LSPLEAALLVAVLTLPFHLLVQWQLGLQSDPRYLRKHGVVIRREEVVEFSGEVIGHYRGRAIREAVVFMGMDYRFARIVAPSYNVQARELLLPPGLLYVTD
jgi:hypothetical protein